MIMNYSLPLNRVQCVWDALLGQGLKDLHVGQVMLMPEQ